MIINITKVITSATKLLTFHDSIFFCRPTRRYATTILIINGVSTEPKKVIIKKAVRIAKENIIVSSLLKIFLKKELICSNIFIF